MGTVLARVPPLPGLAEHLGPGAGGHAHPVASPNMLTQVSAVAFGCPVHLGAPSAAMLAFLARTSGLWINRGLAAMPATTFVAAGSGGGAEAALAALWSVLASHGMIIVPGVPEAADRPGGGPMGAVMAAGHDDAAALNRARAQGARLAHVAGALMAGHLAGRAE